MKASTTLVVLAQAASVLAASVSSLAAECGALKVMEVPEGVDASLYRHCSEHPLSLLHNVLERDEADILERRACYYGVSPACKDGYCRRKCGSGEGPWCWTARNGGFGDWYTCKKNSDCKSDSPCGQSTNSCKECGCSC